ncbi:MAG: nucleotidyltransferase domain-containing protein [Phycicoccus sp.]
MGPTHALDDRGVHGRLRPPWWITGGWSIEVFTGVSRRHEDMDISTLSSDAEAFRLFPR